MSRERSKIYKEQESEQIIQEATEKILEGAGRLGKVKLPGNDEIIHEVILVFQIAEITCMAIGRRLLSSS